jgi:hypothetical protein
MQVLQYGGTLQSHVNHACPVDNKIRLVAITWHTEIIHKRSDLTAPARSHTLGFIDCLQSDTPPTSLTTVSTICGIHEIIKPRNGKQLLSQVTESIPFLLRPQCFEMLALDPNPGCKHSYYQLKKEITVIFEIYRTHYNYRNCTSFYEKNKTERSKTRIKEIC